MGKIFGELLERAEVYAPELVADIVAVEEAYVANCPGNFAVCFPLRRDIFALKSPSLPSSTLPYRRPPTRAAP